MKSAEGPSRVPASADISFCMLDESVGSADFAALCAMLRAWVTASSVSRSC